MQCNPQQLRHGLGLTVGLALQMPLLVCCLEERGQGQETFSLISLNLSLIYLLNLSAASMHFGHPPLIFFLIQDLTMSLACPGTCYVA